MDTNKCPWDGDPYFRTVRSNKIFVNEMIKMKISGGQGHYLTVNLSCFYSFNIFSLKATSPI